MRAHASGQVPADRIIIRLILAIAVIATASAGTRGHPVWVAVIGMAAAVVLAAFLIGASLIEHRPQSWCARHRLPTTIIIIASASVVAAALPVPAVWVSFVGVFAAASASVTLENAALASIPLAVLAIRTWTISHSTWSVAGNVAIAIGVFTLVQMRVRQREADELAAAQRAIIESERSRTLEAQERAQLAGQLHDVLAHTLSGLIVTLQGASLAARKEGISDDLTDRISTATALAKDGLHEARRAVESLRSGEGARQVNPGGLPTEANPVSLDRWLGTTLDRLAGPGTPAVEVIGSAEAVPPQWSPLARSVLMEGLTNSLRHAAGAPIRISLESDTVQVMSIGDPTTFVDLGHPSGGHGLAGLRERVESAGGKLQSGPTSDGYLLTMCFPSTEPSMPSSEPKNPQ